MINKKNYLYALVDTKRISDPVTEEIGIIGIFSDYYDAAEELEYWETEENDQLRYRIIEAPFATKKRIKMAKESHEERGEGSTRKGRVFLEPELSTNDVRMELRELEKEHPDHIVSLLEVENALTRVIYYAKKYQGGKK